MDYRSKGILGNNFLSSASRSTRAGTGYASFRDNLFHQTAGIANRSRESFKGAVARSSVERSLGKAEQSLSRSPNKVHLVFMI